MKKYKKVIIAVLVILTIVTAIFAVNYYCINRYSEPERMIRSCDKVYENYMGKLKNVTIDQENKQIKIDFLGYNFGSFDGVWYTYEAITKVFFDENSNYKDYTLNISFDVDSGSRDGIYYIDKDQNKLKITANEEVDLYLLAKAFPGAVDLRLSHPKYEDINEIKGFKDLRYLHFSNGLTKKEVEYISSVFPKCYLDNNKVQR